jgi:hypothetical protein
MTRKEILNNLKEMNRRGIDSTIKNIAMFLIDKRLFAQKISNIDENDLLILIDNLFINNEIISVDNVDDYFSKETKEYQKITKDNKILLLNYYDINNNLKKCKIYLDDIDYYGFEK